MLKSLSIKNFILIKQAHLDFTKGFNVLCGETGAGKTLIIKALDCVLGGKYNKEVQLDKQKPTAIEAVFEIDNEELTISREINTTSKFRLNGILSSLDEIKNQKEFLVDIHSQHQTYKYMAKKHHINLLDDYITKKSPEFLDLLTTYKQTYSEFKSLEKKLQSAKENYQNNEKEIDFLKFQIKELDDAAIKQDEEQQLQEELNILSNVQELKESSYSSYYALYGDNQSIVEALGKIKYTISSLAELDKNLSDVQNSIYDAFENLKDSANFLKDYSSNLDLNPQRLDELNERISLIQKLKRKYGSDLDEQRDKIEKRLLELTADNNNPEVLEKEYENLLSSLELLASSINEYRSKNAVELSKLIAVQLHTLELKDARFDISITPISLSELGKDDVEFLISTNKSLQPMPLAKIASGGEISRVMLSLKSIFANVDKVRTVVFDEIDTGISGVASNAVAQSIVDLSSSTQIISITHQPIICAKADNFIWVSKTNENDTNIKIEILDNDEKVKAIASLASGEISEKTIEFAKTLVK